MTAPAEGAVEYRRRLGEERFDLAQEDGYVIGACAPGWGCSDRAHTVGCRGARHVSRVLGAASSDGFQRERVYFVKPRRDVMLPIAGVRNTRARCRMTAGSVE